MTTQKKVYYQIALWILLIAAILFLLSLAPILVNPENLAADDFGHFWAAGRLTLHGQNPYDPQAILDLLYQLGRIPDNSSVVSVMLNPPWTLPVVMVFGMISYPVSRMLWLLVNIMILMVSATVLWSIYDGPKKSQWLAWLLAFTFTPAIATLQKGQFTPLVLIGLTGFLLVADQESAQASNHSQKWQSLVVSGFSISLMAIKPQLLYIVWLAILLWCWQKRMWMLLIVGGLILILEIAITSIFNPLVLTQYFQNMAEYPITEWATPTIGSYLRSLFGLDKIWLQFLPTMLGAAWVIFHWYQRRNNWNWISEMPLLILVSLTTNPYSWTYDLALALPVIIYVSANMVTQSFTLRGNTTFKIIIFLYITLNLLNLFLHTRYNEFWFGWFAPGLLLIFLLYRKKTRKFGWNVRTKSFES
jgi:Glycosyltransferase family 87